MSQPVRTAVTATVVHAEKRSVGLRFVFTGTEHKARNAWFDWLKEESDRVTIKDGYGNLVTLEDLKSVGRIQPGEREHQFGDWESDGYALRAVFC